MITAAGHPKAGSPGRATSAARPGAHRIGPGRVAANAIHSIYAVRVLVAVSG
jgi:hypothetical protein